MKGYLFSISVLAGLLFIQSCTNSCCPDEVRIDENYISMQTDSMPTTYWFKIGNDSLLINYADYKEDFYLMESEYGVECGFLGIINSDACESLTKVKTISLINSNANRVLQFHFYESNYSPYSQNGNRVKLTVRSPEFDDDIKVFDFLYDEDGYSEYKELEWKDVNRSRIKTVEYDFENGLQKLEFNEGLVIYAAD